ncbi:ANTAR domain-containing protein [Streptomyces sp. NPDC087568]|uniref:ANTAR domain-containing protein n=1 Tax=unclassified Streptomyces TaxID=2593676 RepID=UPI00380F83DC
MTSVGRRTAAEEAAGEEIVRLNKENAQLRQAVDSHAVIDQAIGVLIAVWRVPPADGWQVLVDVSQQELETAVQRWQHA